MAAAVAWLDEFRNFRDASYNQLDDILTQMKHQKEQEHDDE